MTMPRPKQKTKAKAARKSPARKTSLTSTGDSSSKRRVPAGYKQIDTDVDQYPSWEWDTMGEIQGTVVKLKTVPVRRRDKPDPVPTRMAVVDVSGKKYIVWESAGMGQFMDEVGPGSMILMIPTGTMPLSDSREMRLFDCYVK